MKLALIGYGKMGKMIEQIARERGHEIVSIIDIDNQEEFESEAFKSADVAIEFTAPQVAYGNYLKAACTLEGKTLFWASNFSVGVAIFSAVNKYLAKIMNQFESYDVKMSETHHIHKLDAPSGTAITLAEGIIDNLDRKSDWTHGTLLAADGTLTGSEECADNLIPISSIRRDEVPGIHTVTYDSEADCISITHDAHSRKGFALGAVLAAEYTKNHTGLLTTEDLFKF